MLPFYGTHSKWKRSTESNNNDNSNNQHRSWSSQVKFDAPVQPAADQPREVEGGDNSFLHHYHEQSHLVAAEGDDTRTHELEDTSLDSYRVDGSYGRQAVAFAVRQQESSPSSSSSGNSVQPTLRRRAIQRGGGAARATSASMPKQRLMGRSAQEYPNIGTRRRANLKSRRPADLSAIYRDLVYKFDGRSSVMVVPKSVYQLPVADRRNKSTKHDQESAGIQLFVFGTKHTLSFWMRHGGSSIVSSQQKQFNGNPGKDDQQQQQTHKYHPREHILCAANYEGGQASKLADNVNTNLNSDQQAGQKTNSSGNLGLAHRHHYYSVFVRNCKLILLMRRKLLVATSSIGGGGGANDEERHRKSSSVPVGDSNSTYLPTEWHWTLANNETCDNRWHLYTLNINYPTVELYVDGKQFEENYDNLVIVDDIPLVSGTRQTRQARVSLAESANQPEAREWIHNSHNNNNNNNDPRNDYGTDDNILLTLGACWDARQQQMSGHFRGLISSLTLLLGGNEDSSTVECLGSCTESLVSMANGMPVHDEAEGDSNDQTISPLMTNPLKSRRPNGQKVDNSLVAYQESQSRILLSGHDFLDIEDALAQIAYINWRSLPSIGSRYLSVDTSIECEQVATVSPTISLNASEPTSQTNKIQQDPSPSTIGSFRIPIEQVNVEINVLPSSSLPVISISGTPNLAREYGPFLDGIELFSSINLGLRRLILPSSASETPTNVNGNNDKWQSQKSAQLRSNFSSLTELEEFDYIDDMEATSSGNFSTKKSKVKVKLEQSESTSASHASNWLEDDIKPVEDLVHLRARIEACSVRIYPPLNGLHESLHLPQDQMDKLQLYWRQTLDGLLIYGLDSAENYERLLKLIKYKNRRPNLYSERVFKLLCSDMNGRLVSNEYEQTITMIHLRPGDEQQSDQSMVKLDANEQQQAVPELTLGGDGSSISRSIGNKYAHLRVADLPQVTRSGYEELRFGNFEPIKSFKEQHSTHVEPTGGDKFNRVAFAFLVFVVSLIAMMLCVAFVNLREPSASQSPVAVTTSAINGGDYCGHKQLADESLVALSYDIDSNPYYVEQDEYENEEEGGYMDEEEVDDSVAGYNVETRDVFDEELVHRGQGGKLVGHRKGHSCPIHPPRARSTAPITTCDYHAHYCHLHRKRRNLCADDDETRLSWDEQFYSDEEEDNDINVDIESSLPIARETTTIVTNPMLHGLAATSQNQPANNIKTLVTEQRSDGSGSKRQRAVTRLSEDYFPEAHGSEEIISKVYDQVDLVGPMRRRRDHEVRHKRRPEGGGERGNDDNEEDQDQEGYYLSSFCSSESDEDDDLSSSSSSSSSSTSSPLSVETDLSDLEFAGPTTSVINNPEYHHQITTRTRGKNNVETKIEEEEEEMEYELYHDHNFHHSCLRQQQQQKQNLYHNQPTNLSKIQ